MRHVSLLKDVNGDGIATTQRIEKRIEIGVTVDSGYCVTVMPLSLCQGNVIFQD